MKSPLKPKKWVIAIDLNLTPPITRASFRKTNIRERVFLENHQPLKASLSRTATNLQQSPKMNIHRIHGTIFNLHLPNKLTIHVGKYTIPIDPSERNMMTKWFQFDDLVICDRWRSPTTWFIFTSKTNAELPGSNFFHMFLGLVNIKKKHNMLTKNGDPEHIPLVPWILSMAVFDDTAHLKHPSQLISFPFYNHKGTLKKIWRIPLLEVSANW